jgi:hypothetical protein
MKMNHHNFDTYVSSFYNTALKMAVDEMEANLLV